MPWTVPAGLATLARTDAHDRYIAVMDQRRGLERAERLTQAVQVTRELAETEGLQGCSLQSLRRIQAVILGSDAPFRTTDAFAKKGAERYGWSVDLIQRL